MKNFTYFRPTTAEQAVALLEARWGNTEMLSGGTDLLALQKEYIAQPGRVVSLNGIAGLKTITIGQQSVSIGAGVKSTRECRPGCIVLTSSVLSSKSVVPEPQQFRRLPATQGPHTRATSPSFASRKPSRRTIRRAARGM